ncbi:alkylphosphonate uptake protein PhnA [Neokomagataea thailandica NBRC 106555]|uniref:Alkylphosphonate utilization protein n=2 Tax=Neokomagataea TaxID=1223423 RepID=A0A4Y6V7Q6_9PROT|nr:MULTISPECIES: zinc ribbon domain-containing protein YjdM [Neokomagataea]QDH24576.1 alkylphosphonate utilization protein [Neokomagataea tanensis]GBR52384.1 alkylphosphonate uptake protein PhnA [Neokomagataea thailandica NBRC 106555]
MNTTTHTCPQCTLEDNHLQGSHHVCNICGYEWPSANADTPVDDDIIRDANGTPLSDGDTVMIIKDLKIKGGSNSLKVGTKIKNIRLRGGDHAVEAGSYMLKAEFLRKV